jgi:Transposase
MPLGHATVVVDHFHAVRLANAVVDQVRRRVQQATLGHRGRKPGPLYRIRRLLLIAHEQLTGRGRVRLRAGLAAGDPSGEVAAAWQGKELLRAVYRAVGMPAARAALERFYHWAAGVGVPELSRLARTVRVWEFEVLAFHTTNGCSNGPTEAVNLLIKKVKRVGHGFRNFATTGCGCCCTAASAGRHAGRRTCQAAPHTWRQSARTRNAPSAGRIVGRGRAGEHVAPPRASASDRRQPTERDIEAAAVGGPATSQGGVGIRLPSSRSHRQSWPAHCLLCQFGLARRVPAGRRGDAASLRSPR